LTTHLSGSPIIQNGKLVDVVTHVLINDPTTSYGIFIENMLSAAQMPQARRLNSKIVGTGVLDGPKNQNK
jgi:hypothetical protein